MGPVVVGIDGSDHSMTAVDRARSEAAWRGVPLHIVYVTDYTPALLHLPGDVTVDTSDLAAAQRTEAWARVAGSARGSSSVERVDLTGYPADALVEYCDEVDASLLVVGTRGRGSIVSTLLGSTSKGVVERAACDVLVAKSRRSSGV